MKKTLAILVFAFSASVLPFTVLAEETAGAVAETQVTAKDLGVVEPGLLPTSPFYFFKSFTRGVERIFTFNPVKKAELELNIANEQAAEIATMKESTPDRIDAIAKAAGNYRKNVDRLRGRLDNLKETSQNPNVDKLMEKLADRSVKHQELFDELKQKFENKPELKQRLEGMRGAMDETLAKIPEKFDTPEAFKERMKKAAGLRADDPWSEIRGMEMMERIGEKLPEDRRASFEGAKDELMKKLGERVNAMPEDAQKTFIAPHLLERTIAPGDPDFDLRMRILEEVKESASLPQAVIERIGSAQGQALKEAAAEQGEALRGKAAEQIMRAEKAIVALRTTANNPSLPIPTGVSFSDVVSKMKNTLAQAQKHLENAKKAMASGTYGEAFGQANSAEMIARNALRGVTLPKAPPTPMPATTETSGARIPAPTETSSVQASEGTIAPAPAIMPTQTGGIVCTQEYLPVCGFDNRTYSNACHAKVAGVAIRAPGVCKETDTTIRQTEQQQPVTN